jgi:hypothetical protein
LVQCNIQGNVTTNKISLKNKDFCEIGGESILRVKYRYSLYALLSAIYPDYQWLPWKFINCPRNWWDDKKNQKKFMDWAAQQLSIKEDNDWYKVTYKVSFPMGTIFILQGIAKFGGLFIA